MTPVIKLALFLSIVCFCYSAPCIGKDCESSNSAKTAGSAVKVEVSGKLGSDGSDSCGEGKSNVNSIESHGTGPAVTPVGECTSEIEGNQNGKDVSKTGDVRKGASKAAADLVQAKKSLEKASNEVKAANAEQSEARKQLQSANKSNQEAKKHLKTALKEKKKAESEIKSAENQVKKEKLSENCQEGKAILVAGTSKNNAGSNLSDNGSCNDKPSSGTESSSVSASAASTTNSNTGSSSGDNGSCNDKPSSGNESSSVSASAASTTNSNTGSSSGDNGSCNDKSSSGTESSSGSTVAASTATASSASVASASSQASEKNC